MMLRDAPAAWLPALVAVMMFAGGNASALPAAAGMVTLCSGGSASLPGKPMQRECDKACHASCNRRKRD